MLARGQGRPSNVAVGAAPWRIGFVHKSVDPSCGGAACAGPRETSKRVPNGAIAGTCAAVAVVALGLLGLCYWRRRRGAAQKLEAKASGATAAPNTRMVPAAAATRM